MTNISGITNQWQEIFSAKGITFGRSTSKTIIDGLTKEYEMDVSNTIRKEAGNNKKKILMIFCNYNILRWLKRRKTEATFTSISILVKILPREEKDENAGEAFVPFLGLASVDGFCNARTVYMDGTFSIFLPQFYQVFSIHFPPYDSKRQMPDLLLLDW